MSLAAEKGKALIIDKLQWRFALLGLLSSAYTFTGMRSMHILAFIASILVSACVTAIYIEVKRSHRGGNLADEREFGRQSSSLAILY